MKSPKYLKKRPKNEEKTKRPKKLNDLSLKISTNLKIEGTLKKEKPFEILDKLFYWINKVFMKQILKRF